MSSILNGVSAFLALTASALFTVASIGYADDRASLKSAAWIIISSQKDCPDNWCDTCNVAGNSAFALVLVSLVLSFLVALINGGLIISPNFYLQVTNIVFAFISGLFSLIAIGNFMSLCWESVELSDDVTSTTDFEQRWGPGAITAIVAMLLMWIVTLLQAGAAAIAPKNTNQADSQF